MTYPIFQVDAFTAKAFGGNPAAVVPLGEWPDDHLMQQIAAENNLSETAFFVPLGEGEYHLRWFTPVSEVRLCGHATLATGHVLYQHLAVQQPVLRFRTKAGELMLSRTADGYRLDFPADLPQPVDPPDGVQLALGVTPLETFSGADDLLIIVDHEEQVARLQPDLPMLARVEKRGILVSAPGKDADFVSRCFFPRFGINEDPVTGSAHTLMTPYWARRLQKNELTAIQLSTRKGHLRCTLHQDRVWLDGQAVTYLVGQIMV